jgi:choline dehydrogenase-like flavoprotein
MVLTSPREQTVMASFDYDVVIIGSGFGGSVAALRAAEKGYRVGAMEAGRRWKDEDIPKTNWNPSLTLSQKTGPQCMILIKSAT